MVLAAQYWHRAMAVLSGTDCAVWGYQGREGTGVLEAAAAELALERVLHMYSEAGLSHQACAEAGPSHQIYSEAGPAELQAEAGPLQLQAEGRWQLEGGAGASLLLLAPPASERLWAGCAEMGR
eukprot:1613003-Rhodomonas_salina.1